MTSSKGNNFHVTGPLCGNSPVTGEFTRPVTKGFGVFFDLHLNKRFYKQSRRRWFDTPSRSLWRHCTEHASTHWQVQCPWQSINNNAFDNLDKLGVLRGMKIPSNHFWMYFNGIMLNLYSYLVNFSNEFSWGCNSTDDFVYGHRSAI